MSGSSGRRALVAGASGLVGRALLSLLEARGTPVEVLLRRPLADLAQRARRRVHVVDFTALPALPPVDDVFIALGTTIKVAGSQAAFRAVDFDAVVAVGHAARAAGATRLGLVSALGANRHSLVFYNRVKGDAEAAVAGLGFASVTIARPSFITGDRAALGQPDRPGEGLALAFARSLGGLVPAPVRPVAASAVAAALVDAVGRGDPGVRIVASKDMQALT